MSRRLGFVGVGIALVVAACATDSSTPAPAMGGSFASAASAPPGTGVAAFPSGLIVGEGDALLAAGTDGLDTLESYVATLDESFEGTDDGATARWSGTTTYAFVREPFATLITVEQPADRPTIFSGWSATADGADYARADDGSCTAALAAPLAPVDRDVRHPAARLPGFVGAAVTGSDVLDGILVDVAALTPAALGWSAETSASGNVAIATTGGYVVRYDLVTAGGPELFGGGLSGILTRHYALSSIATASITIPAGCPAGLIIGPQPVDAVTLRSLPGFLELTTNGSVVETAALYRDTGLAFGWTRTGEPTISEDLGALRFTAPGFAITVMITRIDDGAKVEVLATRT